MSLSKLITDAATVRAALREQGASKAEIDSATERIVRHYWAPLVPDERFWPDSAARAVCSYCDGTGLVMHRNVRNRLGVFVDEGEPCRCALGFRFTKMPRTEQDHMQAGRTPKQTKPWTKLGRA